MVNIAGVWSSNSQGDLSMPLDYEALYLQAYRDNVRHIRPMLDSGRLEDKINNFCRRFDIERDRVEAEIRNNDVVAALFAPDPSKQNIYEKIAADFISCIPGVSDFRNLPNNELVVLNGGVQLKRDLMNRGGVADAKTIDFKWRYRGMHREAPTKTYRIL